MELLGKRLNVIIWTFAYKPFAFQGPQIKKRFIWKVLKITSPPFTTQFPFMYFIDFNITIPFLYNVAIKNLFLKNFKV